MFNPLLIFKLHSLDADAGCPLDEGPCGSKQFVNTWYPALMTSLPEQPKFGGIYVLDTMLNFIDVNNSQDLPLGFSQVRV